MSYSATSIQQHSINITNIIRTTLQPFACQAQHVIKIEELAVQIAHHCHLLTLLMVSPGSWFNQKHPGHTGRT